MLKNCLYPLACLALLASVGCASEPTPVASNPSPTVIKLKAEATPTQKAKPPELPAVKEAKPTSTEPPEFVAFDPAVCKTDAYLPVNGASTALYTTCQYLNVGSIKPESVSVVTAANGNNDPSVLELEAESGFERVMWTDYSLSNKDACVEYKDKSISCYKFSAEPGEESTEQSQSQMPDCTKSDCDCSDFTSPVQAQRVLDAYPSDPFKLDKDKDGSACEAG